MCYLTDLLGSFLGVLFGGFLQGGQFFFFFLRIAVVTFLWLCIFGFYLFGTQYADTSELWGYYEPTKGCMAMVCMVRSPS